MELHNFRCCDADFEKINRNNDDGISTFSSEEQVFFIIVYAIYIIYETFLSALVFATVTSNSGISKQHLELIYVFVCWTGCSFSLYNLL